MDKERFIKLIEDSVTDRTFLKLTLSKYVGHDDTLQNVYLKLIKLKESEVLSFIFRHKTKDVTQNFSLNEAMKWLLENLGSDFLSADLFTNVSDYSLLFNKKREAKILKKKASNTQKNNFQHDRQKNRTFLPNTSTYLCKLGITNSQGEILKEGQRKYRQIDKYIEIIDATLNCNY